MILSFTVYNISRHLFSSKHEYNLVVHVLKCIFFCQNTVDLLLQIYLCRLHQFFVGLLKRGLPTLANTSVIRLLGDDKIHDPSHTHTHIQML